MRGQLEGKMQFGKSNANSNAIGNKAEGLGSSSHDRLIYVSTCLIGLPVEVHVKNGSIFSGIFHTISTEKDFGVVLKMARSVTNGSQKGQKNISEGIKRPQTVIIPSRDLVQVVAKDVTLTGDGISNGNSHDKRQDLMIDSAISLSRYVEERELERWAPDDDDPQCPELENIFDGSWNRKWDQFETNETLFGVKSTFDEELYTTKLERGPQMRELEREALRIAREIEGEETEDLHLAEERGFRLHKDFNLDEESRYSAVCRRVDNGACDESDHTDFGSSNARNVGDYSDSSITSSFLDASERNICDAAPTSTSSKVDNGTSSNNSSGTAHNPDFTDQGSPVPDDSVSMDFLSLNDENRKENYIAVDGGNNIEKASQPELKDSQSEDSAVSSKVPLSAQPLNSHPRHMLSSSDHVGSGSGPCLSPSSSVGSVTSEKSKLNPYAKEFKFNPNAKSFTPSSSSSSLRPQSPVSDGSFYYATNVSAVPPMHGLPVGVGIGPPYGGNQPVVYNPQAVPMQSSQAYIHPNGPLYQQQMYLGQPRPVLYMPAYHPSPEMPYKGREF